MRWLKSKSYNNFTSILSIDDVKYTFLYYMMSKMMAKLFD